MECKYCKHILSTKSALNTHQTKAKYCLKLQGKQHIKGEFVCKLCNKDFFNNNRYKYHINKCVSADFYIKQIEDINTLLSMSLNENIRLKKENEMLTKENENFRADYKELSITILFVTLF